MFEGQLRPSCSEEEQIKRIYSRYSGGYDLARRSPQKNRQGTGFFLPSIEEIDYAEGIRTFILDGDVVRNLYDLDTEDREYREDNEASNSNENLSINQNKNQPLVNTQKLDKIIKKESHSGEESKAKQSLINKSKRNQKKKIKVALIKNGRWTTIHILSLLISYALLGSILVLGLIWLSHNTSTTYELRRFSNLNYAIGMKLFSLSQIFNHITILNVINRGWKMAQDFSPEIKETEFTHEVYHRLIASFTLFDYFDNMVTKNLNKFAIAETLLKYNNQPIVDIWQNENLINLRTINQCTTELKAMSLSIIDQNSTVIREDDINIAYILHNSNNGIRTSLELEENFVKEKISEEIEGFIDISVIMRLLFILITMV